MRNSSNEKRHPPRASNKIQLQLKSKSRRKGCRKGIQSKWPRPAPSLVFLSSSLLTSAELSAATRRGREPRGLRLALLRLRGVYSPTHYYVRVSRAAIFTGTGPSLEVSALLHIARRGPRLAPPSTTVGTTRNQDGTKGGRGDASGALGDHGSSAGGRLAGASLAEGLPSGNALLHVTRGGALLLASPAQPLVSLS